MDLTEFLQSQPWLRRVPSPVVEDTTVDVRKPALEPSASAPSGQPAVSVLLAECECYFELPSSPPAESLEAWLAADRAAEPGTRLRFSPLGCFAVDPRQMVGEDCVSLRQAPPADRPAHRLIGGAAPSELVLRFVGAMAERNALPYSQSPESPPGHVPPSRLVATLEGFDQSLLQAADLAEAVERSAVCGDAPRALELAAQLMASHARMLEFVQRGRDMGVHLDGSLDQHRSSARRRLADMQALLAESLDGADPDADPAATIARIVQIEDAMETHHEDDLHHPMPSPSVSVFRTADDVQRFLVAAAQRAVALPPLLVGATPAPGPAAPPPGALLKAAVAFRQLGHLREAEECLLSHLRAVPASPEASAELLEVYEMQGMVQPAIELLAQGSNAAGYLSREPHAKQLLEEITYMSSLERAGCSPALYAALLQFYVAKSEASGAFNEIKSRLAALGDSHEWLAAAAEALPLIESVQNVSRTRAQDPNQFVAVKLEVLCRMVLQSLNTPMDASTEQLIRDYRKAIEESDSVIPILGKPDEQDGWTHLRMEHNARLCFIRAKHLLSDRCRAARALDETERIGEAIKLLRSSLEEPLWDHVQFRFPSRISEGAYIVASLLLEPSDARSPNDFVQLGLPRKEGVALDDLLYSLLGVKTVHPALENCAIKAALEHPWDLQQFLVFASWHFYSGKLREFLRQLLPQMSERANLLSPGRFDKIGFKMSVTISDMEVFFVLLFQLQRVQSVVQSKSPEAVACAPSLSARGACRIPETAIAFWRRMLVDYGRRRPETAFYQAQAMSDAATRDFVAQLRGSTHQRGPEIRFAFGIVGACFFELESALGLDRSDEAKFYLDTYASWNESKHRSGKVNAEFIEACVGLPDVDVGRLQIIFGVSEARLLSASGSQQSRVEKVMIGSPDRKRTPRTPRTAGGLRGSARPLFTGELADEGDDSLDEAPSSPSNRFLRQMRSFEAIGNVEGAADAPALTPIATTLALAPTASDPGPPKTPVRSRAASSIPDSDISESLPQLPSGANRLLRQLEALDMISTAASSR
nr:hypothetical protein HK105_003325 [Polyrhizophydium stewartii]